MAVAPVLTPLEVAEGSLLSLTVLFLLIEIFVIKQVWWLFQRAVQSTFTVSFSGEKTRAFFMIFLCVAIFIRIVSLVLLFFLKSTYSQVSLMGPGTAASDIQNPADSGIWTYTALVGLPAIVFQSAYSIIILFWAQVYYTARFITLPYLRPAFGFCNVAVYMILVVVGSLTRILKAYREFRLDMCLLVGALYTLTSIAFCFFGFKVALQFSGGSDNRAQSSRRAAVVKRVLSLSLVCPILFQARGLFNLAVGLQLIEGVGPWFGQYGVTWECLIIFISEWIPAIFVLLSFWPPQCEKVPENTMSSRSVGSTVNPTFDDMSSPLLGGPNTLRGFYPLKGFYPSRDDILTVREGFNPGSFD